MYEANTRCPLQSECDRKCTYQHHERDCNYYRGNSRPGMDIPDQEKLIVDEYETAMSSANILSASSAEIQPEPDMIQVSSSRLVHLPVKNLFPHPYNPRKDLGDLTELADSIKANGILQNLTVIPMELVDPDSTIELGDNCYVVVIGHRRLAAAKLAGLTEVPCVIAEMGDNEQIQTMLMENIQRADLKVYEQAQGFQMMLDLGSTIEEISEKSGFSKKNVKRHVKMMELDQDVLKQVSERQLSLTDFDKLTQIEDIKVRNQCLEQIGTSQFDQSVSVQLRKQDIKKNLPLIKKTLRESKAKALKQSECWNGKYDSIGSCYISDWKEVESSFPQNVKGQLFYYLDDQYGRLSFYEERKRAAPVKKSAEQIEREKQIAATWNELDEKVAVAYDLRSKFVKGLKWNKAAAASILRGAVMADVLHGLDYTGTDRNAMGKILGIDANSYDSNRGMKLVAAVSTLKDSDIPALIYTMFCDSSKDSFTSGYRGQYPSYKASSNLAGLYGWLTSIGYEMSEDEKALLDGTHELLHRGDLSPDSEQEATPE